MRSRKEYFRLLAFVLAAPAIAAPAYADSPPEAPYVIVLGIAQDGGVPQTGSHGHPGWKDPDRRRRVVCLGIVDPRSGKRWMIEATPDFPEQLYLLNGAFPRDDAPGLDGVFLTHAHIGHYTGLMFLGHESLGARGVRVYAMPRMGEFITSNGPWDQLVRYENIVLAELADGRAVTLADDLRVTPFLVPHRQEYSEVVGYEIEGPNRRVVFIPDIDSWEAWEDWETGGRRVEDVAAGADVLYIDATFFSGDELPGRDMSQIPHPTIRHSMDRLGGVVDRADVRFIHLNHTNPALRAGSAARGEIERRGFRVAEPLERVPL